MGMFSNVSLVRLAPMFAVAPAALTASIGLLEMRRTGARMN
jgi:hypothetical protein